MAEQAMMVLASHGLCPYVQRAAIVLLEKGVAFERREVDLGDKPEWFLKVSPLGKTPVLLIPREDGARAEALFESAVICEYLDETHAPRLHPPAPLDRARHRAWMEFGSAMLNTIAAFYNAPDEAALAGRAQALRAMLRQLEAALGDGPYFGGERFSLVDAVFGPVFRYFDAFERMGGEEAWGFFDGLQRVQSWRLALAARASVRQAVTPDFAGRLHGFLLQRGSALSARASA
jgi:glutathione S-transferase